MRDLGTKGNYSFTYFLPLTNDDVGTVFESHSLQTHTYACMERLQGHRSDSAILKKHTSAKSKMRGNDRRNESRINMKTWAPLYNTFLFFHSNFHIQQPCTSLRALRLSDLCLRKHQTGSISSCLGAQNRNRIVFLLQRLQMD